MVHRVRYPFIEGHEEGFGERRITLTDASVIRVRRPNYGGTVALVLGVTAGVAVLVGLPLVAVFSYNPR